MTKRLLIAGFVLATGLALSARPASAQTNTYDVDLFGTLGEPGQFHVKLEKWDGTLDGPGKTFRITQVISHQFPDNPVSMGAEVDISFYGSLGGGGGTLQIASITGDAGTTTTTSSIPPNPHTHDWAIAMYNGAGTKFGSFTTPGGAATNYIRKNANTQFLQNSSGRITTASLAGSAQISVITDNGHIYSGIVDLSTTAAPEASSMALLLPGLIPLGLVLRRRARSKTSAS